MTILPGHEQEQHAAITILGDVQGVFFRRSAKQKAEQFGISGFARNESDGSVFIEAEGTESAIKKFIDWCQDGSHAASVSSVDVEYGEFKNYYGFEIR